MSMTKKPILWIAVFCIFAAQALASIVHDSTTYAAADQNPSFSHTIGEGSNRLLIVAIGFEHTDNSLSCSGATYNSVPMTLIDSEEAETGGYAAETCLYYLDESGLPSAGTYTVSVTISGNPDRETAAGAMSYSGVAQKSYEDSCTGFQTTDGVGTVYCILSTSTNDAWVMSVVENGNLGDYTHNSGTKRWEQDGAAASDTAAGGDKVVVAAGSNNVSWVHTNSNRHSIVAAAFAPFAQMSWSQATLNMGSGDLNLGSLTGHANITSTGHDNDDVAVTCLSGDCGTITDDWTDNTNMAEDEKQEITFTCDDSDVGSFSAVYNVNSHQDSTGDNITVSCQINQTYGSMSVTLNTPASGANVSQGEFFWTNATITCSGTAGATCGEVTGTARHNTTGDTMTSISTTTGATPFYTTDSNPKSCGVMYDGDSCQLNWSINPTGTLGDYHKIGIRFTSSNSSRVSANETSNATVWTMGVEWQQSTLDLGSVVLGGEDLTSSMVVDSTGVNTDVAVSCSSGDCSTITTNWTTKSMSDGESVSAGFTCSAADAGSFEAVFDLTSDEDSGADTITVNCSILAPDLRIISANITFDDYAPSENQVVTITAGVYNDGTYDATNAIVRFYEGHYSTGTQIGTDHIMNISAGDSTIVQQSWTAKIGAYDLYVVLDPPVDTNGSISESNESNNHAYQTIDVSLWSVFVGNVTGWLALQTEQNQTILKWNVTDTTDSIVYVTDTDSNPDFSSLQALGRNTSGAYMADDFTELDNALNTTHYPDSINLTYTSGGNPIETQSFSVFGTALTDVPIINSTNNSNFVSGILWDSSDDSNNNGQFDNTSKEDVVFVTRVNQSKQGMYGTYDYEIRVPARLRNYKTPNVLTVTFYTEIK